MKLTRAIALAALLPVGAFAQTANISRTDLTTSGVNLTSSAQNAPGVIYMPNDGRSLLYIDNRSVSTGVTATITTQKTSVTKDGYGTISLSDQVVSIPSSSRVIVGPFPTGRWNSTGGSGGGTVRVSMSTVTPVSTTSLRLP